MARLEDLIPAALSQRLSALATRRSYQDREIVQMRGDTDLGFSIVRDGLLRVGNQGLDGSYLTTSVLSRGQCFGELSMFTGLPRTHDITALGGAVVDEIPKKQFMKVFSTEPKLAESLLKVSLTSTHRLLEFMDDLRRLPLNVHVAKFVLAAIDETGVMRMKQEDMAFTFGVSRVSMGKVLKGLERSNLIELGYGKIKVSAPEHLSAFVDEHALIQKLDVPQR